MIDRAMTVTKVALLAIAVCAALAAAYTRDERHLWASGILLAAGIVLGIAQSDRREDAERRAEQ